MRFILASASPRREELLKSILDDFEVMPSQIDEKTGSDYPDQLVLDNALAKARDIAGKHPDAVVIGADTVVVLDNRILGKPADQHDAVRMLRTLSGKTHQVVTGIAIISLKSNKELVDLESSNVTFNILTDEQIEKYVNEKKPLDKAGSYGIQEIGEQFVAQLEGSYENVVGLPVQLVAEMLDSILESMRD